MSEMSSRFFLNERGAVQIRPAVKFNEPPAGTRRAASPLPSAGNSAECPDGGGLTHHRDWNLRDVLLLACFGLASWAAILSLAFWLWRAVS